MLHKDTINISINHYILLVPHVKIPYSCDSLIVERLRGGGYPISIDEKAESLTLTGEALSVLFEKMICLKRICGPNRIRTYDPLFVRQML